MGRMNLQFPIDQIGKKLLVGLVTYPVTPEKSITGDWPVTLSLRGPE